LKSDGIQDLPRPHQGGALTGEIDDSSFEPSQNALSNVGPSGLVPDEIAQQSPDDPVQKLRQLISNRQDDTIDVLRTWVEDSEENA